SRRRHLCDAELLRPGYARTADVAKRSEDARHSANRVQICREFRPDAANSRTGRNIRRFDQTLEWSMTIITTPHKARPPEVIKDASMAKQKEMMNGHYERLANAPERGEKVAATFVPGNLNELLMCFAFANTLP